MRAWGDGKSGCIYKFFMDNATLKKFFDFTTSMEELKKIERYKGQFFWRDYPGPAQFESVADHTWRLAILVLLFSDQLSQKFDLEKTLKMVLVHDVPEIIAGDASPLGEDGTGKNVYAFDAEKAKARHEQEKSAAVKLFSSLPIDLSTNLFNLWLEYDQQTSFEAKVVKTLDKIEALIQVLEYTKGNLFAEHLEFASHYSLKGSDIDPAIEQFGQYVFAEVRKNYKKFTK